MAIYVAAILAPIVAGAVAARRCTRSGPLFPLTKAAVRQTIAAGLCTGLVGALFVTVLGTGTIALMPGAGWLRHWLYPGQHLLAGVAYNRQLTASVNAAGYFLILLVFPVVGLIMGAFPAASVPGGPRPPGRAGPPGPESPPNSPDGGRMPTREQARTGCAPGSR